MDRNKSSRKQPSLCESQNCVTKWVVRKRKIGSAIRTSFISARRLSRSGVFEAFFQLLAECSQTAHLVQFFDSTTARAHVSPPAQKRLCCVSSVVSLFDDPACIATPQGWRAAPPPASLSEGRPLVSGGEPVLNTLLRGSPISPPRLRATRASYVTRLCQLSSLFGATNSRAAEPPAQAASSIPRAMAVRRMY